jgi:hypothetical protein
MHKHHIVLQTTTKFQGDGFFFILHNQVSVPLNLQIIVTLRKQTALINNQEREHKPPFKHVYGFDPGGKVNINLTLT